jgi:hypothetical protein
MVDNAKRYVTINFCKEKSDAAQTHYQLSCSPNYKQMDAESNPNRLGERICKPETT